MYKMYKMYKSSNSLDHTLIYLNSFLLALFLSENYLQGTVEPPFRLQTTYRYTSKEDV